MAELTVRSLGDLPWWVVTGESGAAFRLLGERAAGRIRDVLGGMSELDALRRRAATPAVAELRTRVVEATRATYPRGWAELTALADGAGVPPDDLVLLNLRADLGTDDGMGCTDLGYLSRNRALLAHNEDGSPALDGRCVLVTLALDGEIPVTVWWYPGFLPSNTFAVTGGGVVWSLDAVHVPTPAHAPGRHFVAREAQRQTGFEQAVRHVTENPSAGGFVYNVADAGSESPRLSVVEAAAGISRRVDADPDRPGLLWHSNHLRWISGVDSPYENTVLRAEFLTGLDVPEAPDPDWMLAVLAGSPLPHGVRRDDEASGSVTLCTMVADLRRRELTLRPRGRATVTVPFAEFELGA